MKHHGAALSTTAKDKGHLKNKFMVYCASYANLLVYYATGGYSATENGSTDPKTFVPGDIITFHYKKKDASTIYGHTYMYLDDAGDDDPYTFTVATSPGPENTNGVRHPSVGVCVSRPTDILKSDSTEWFRIDGVQRISAADAEKVNMNRLRASLKLYDRLDFDSPKISEVSSNDKGEINIIAIDPKIYKAQNYQFYQVGVQDPLIEPGSSGIVGYQITETNEQPDSGWIEIERTEELNITTAPVEKSGTYYAWVEDSGGNVDYKKIKVTVKETSTGSGNGSGSGTGTNKQIYDPNNPVASVDVDIPEEINTSKPETMNEEKDAEEKIVEEKNNASSLDEKVESTNKSEASSNVDTKISADDSFFKKIEGLVDSFKETGDENQKEINAGNMINDIGGILTTIGIVAVLAGILIVGIKYMLASPEEAAKLKTSLIGLVLAGIVIIGAYGIWMFVKNLLTNIGT